MINLSKMHPSAINLLVSTGLTYGIAFAGRRYLPIDPLKTALFSTATFITASIGDKIFEPTNYTLLGRGIKFISVYTPAAIALSSSIFSPVQTVINLALTNLIFSFYYMLTERNLFRLKF